MDNGLLNAGMEESKDLVAPADGSTGPWKDDQVVYRDEILTGYTDFKGKLDTELKANAEGFVRIGYLLKVARDTNILAESGYKNVAEFAFAEYQLTKDIVSRYIAINDKYAENGYSDKLQTKFEGFGVAKLQEMLTLPDAIIEEIEPTLTRREIIDIKREVAAEEAITPIEMAIEAAAPEVQKEEKELTLTQRVWKDIIKSLWDKYNVRDKNSALNRIITTEYPFVTDESFTKPLELALYELIAPSGTATLWARIPGVGRYMVTVKGLDEPINMVNARDGSKINTSFADAVRDIADIFDGECTPESWERVYGLANPQYEKPETKIPESDKKTSKNTENVPKNTENAQKRTENTQNHTENAQNLPEGTGEIQNDTTKKYQDEIQAYKEKTGWDPDADWTPEKGREYEEKEKVAPVQQREMLGICEIGDKVVNTINGEIGMVTGECNGQYKIYYNGQTALADKTSTRWNKCKEEAAEGAVTGEKTTAGEAAGEETAEPVTEKFNRERSEKEQGNEPLQPGAKFDPYEWHNRLVKDADAIKDIFEGKYSPDAWTKEAINELVEKAFELINDAKEPLEIRTEDGGFA